MSLVTQINGAIDKAFAVTSGLTGPMVVRQVSSVFDPGTGETVVTNVDHAVLGLFDDSEESGLELADIINGERVAWVQSKEYAPSMDDILVGPDLAHYTIKAMKPIQPYDETFIYEMVVRR